MPAPITLKLPAWLVREGFRLGSAVARDPRWDVPGTFALPRLRMSGPERRFARTVLARRPNWWVYRCRQDDWCGDFVLVPMSSPRPDRRVPVVLELKERSAVRPGGGLQLRNAPGAVGELARLGLVGGGRHVTMEGSTDAVLGWLGAQPP